MALVERRSGCRVGWYTFDNHAEAVRCSEEAKVTASRMRGEGYTFGFQTPGEIRFVPGTDEQGDRWVVTIP